MYKILVVDDEKIIREGLSTLIDWKKHDCYICASAENGLAAIDCIKAFQPDIVITDLKMPGMDGLELISKSVAIYPNLKFIVLSGYGEFDYAKQAMRYGVRYFVLKPCDDNELIGYLESILKELKQQEREKLYVTGIERSMNKILPHVKEKFLRDLALGKTYTDEELSYFINLFRLGNLNFRLIILKMESDCGPADKLALKNLISDIIYKENIDLNAIINNELLVLIHGIALEMLSNLLLEVKNSFKLSFCTGVSGEKPVKYLNEMYSEVHEFLQCEFYTTSPAIVTAKNFSFNAEPMAIDPKVYNVILNSVEAGNIDDLTAEISEFFRTIRDSKCEIQLAKTYCAELFLNLIRLSDRKTEYYKYLSKIEEMNRLTQIYNLIMPIAAETAKSRRLSAAQHSAAIRSMIDCVAKNLENPGLSLSWIAKTALFMNENYLGKLFLKETGERFSQYVVKTRMEKAKEYMESPVDYKIFEIAQKTGFGDNTQYFSQVFKKHFGYRPTDFKNILSR